MKIIAIIAGAGVLPLVWSWLVYRLMGKLWPVRSPVRASDDPGSFQAPDYQI